MNVDDAAGPENDSSPEPKLPDSIVAEFLDAEAVGKQVDREALVHQYPQHEASLRAFFHRHDQLRLVQSAEATLWPANNQVTLPPRSRPTSVDEPTLPPKADLHKETTLPLPGGDVSTEGVLAGAMENTPQPGDKVRYFGDYELLEEIARGGMGIVFKARQVNLNRLVALKMILAGQLASEEDVQRFYTEAEAAANLDHPGIVPIFEIGEHAGQHYFSMGYIEGKSLADKVADGPLSATQAARLTSQIASAIAFAHSRDVIHRDLKPANILLDLGEQPKVTDFGLAKRTKADSGLTGSGQILGTPSYMAPEQAGGQADQVGPLADVYALGAILYCLVTGRPPFQAANPMDTLLQVLDKEPPPPRQLNPSVPVDLETICLKCLSKDPARRYTSAVALAEELDRFVAGEPILARPVSRLERAWRWSKRHPALAMTSAAVVLLTATLAMGGPLVAVNQARLRAIAADNEARAEQLAASESDARKAAEATQAELAKAKEQSDHTLYARSISLAFEQFRSANLMSAEDTLGGLPAKQRGFEWNYVNQLCNQELARLTGLASRAQQLAIAPDGVHITAIQGGDQAHVIYWQRDSASPQRVQQVTGLAINSTGEKIAIIDPNATDHLSIVDVISGQELHRFAATAEVTRFSAFGGPGDRLFASVATDKSVRVWDTISGREITKIEIPWRRRLYPIALSHSGRSIAWRRRDDGAVIIRETKTGKIRYESPGVDKLIDYNAPLAFAPDDRMLAVGSYRSVEIRKAATGEVTQSLDGISGYALSLAYSPDGRFLAVSSEDGAVRVFNAANGKLFSELTGHGAGEAYGIPALAFSADGHQVISAGSDLMVKVWDIWCGDRESLAPEGIINPYYPRPNQTVDYLTTAKDGIEALEITPDGSKLFVAGRDDKLRVFEPNSGKVLRQFAVTESVGALAYSEDTGMLVSGGGGIRDRQPGAIVARDLESGEELWRYTQAPGPVSKLAFLNNGTQLAATMGSQNVNLGGLILLDAQTGQPIWTSERLTYSIRDMAVSPNNKLIATVGGAGGVQLTNAEDGSFVGNTGGRVYFAVDFSSDGKWVAAGGIDWTLRLFDTENGDEIWNSTRHSGAITDLAFVENDKRIATTSIDGTTRVWDTRFGDLILTWEDDGAAKLALAASSDASVIASSGVHDTVFLRKTGSQSSKSNDPPWDVLLEDDFERSDLGENWTAASGEWRIENGAAVGKLAAEAIGPEMGAAFLSWKGILPTNSEIEYELTIFEPMMVQDLIGDRGTKNHFSACYIGITGLPFNRGEPGVSLVTHTDGMYREVASRRDGRFTLEPNRTYKIRTRRLNGLAELYIDDELYRSAQVAFDLALPYLSFQGIFGKVGSEFKIDNIKISVPTESAIDIQATRVVIDLYDALKLKPLVSRHLANATAEVLLSGATKQFSAEAVRRRAIEVARRWPQKDADILQTAKQAATANDLDAAEFAALADWIAANVRPVTEEAQRVRAMCALRAAKIGDAWESLNQCMRAHRDHYGYKHPIDVAIAALLHEKQSDGIQAQKEREQLEQLTLADRWSEDAIAQAWIAEIRERVEPLEVADEATYFSQKVWDLTDTHFIGGDLQPYRETLAQDAKFSFRRLIEENGPYERQVSADAWLAAESLAWQGKSAGLNLVRTNHRVNLQNTFAVLNGEFVLQFEAGFFAWQQTNVFAKQDASDIKDWKLVSTVIRMKRLRLGDLQFDMERDGWEELDRLADNEDAQSLGKVRLLRMASREQESLAVAQELAAQHPSPAVFKELFESAYSASNAELMQSAAKQAITLDPMVTGMPAIRRIAVQQLQADEPVDVGKGIRVRPPSFYRRGSNELLAAGPNGLAAWLPTNESLIGLLGIDQEGNLDEMTDGMVESRVSLLKAKTLSKGSMTVAGFPARTFAQEAPGIGRAITGQGNRLTTQHFVVIRREKDFVVFLLSCYSDEYPLRDAEFLEFLEHVQL
ncbi:protein kinase domain-containing protein [Planctomycetaceae bacterium SH139]